MLAGRRVVHFVDNTVALSAIVHGYARKPDMAVLSNAYTLVCDTLLVGVNVIGKKGLPRAVRPPLRRQA